MPPPFRRSTPLRHALGFLAALGGFCLTEASVSTGLDLVLEGSVGLHGGARGGEALHGLALGSIDWRGAEDSGPSELHGGAHLSVLALTGRGPTGRYLGDFLGASNMEGHAGPRLYSWWVEAKSRDWSLRLGALLGDEEFATTEAGGNFLNSAFGWPAFISANTINTGPAFFVPALGFRFEQAWSDRGAWRIGVYDGDSFDSAAGDPHVNRHGTRFHLGGEQGCFMIGEVSWSPAAHAPAFKAGVWMHTARFADVRDDASGRPHAITGDIPRSHGSNYGGYAVLEFAVPGGERATDPAMLFIRAGAAPADRNTIAWAVDAGVSKRGFLPGRPADVAYLGVTRARFSSRYAAHERLTAPGAAAPDFEQIVEAGYVAAITGNWSLQPDLQYIRYPGGVQKRPDALVLLVRSNLSF